MLQQLHPVPTRLPRQRVSYVDLALATCTHVFLRHDAVRSPLQPPYDGPYLVVKRYVSMVRSVPSRWIGSNQHTAKHRVSRLPQR